MQQANNYRNITADKRRNAAQKDRPQAAIGNFGRQVIYFLGRKREPFGFMAEDIRPEKVKCGKQDIGTQKICRNNAQQNQVQFERAAESQIARKKHQQLVWKRRWDADFLDQHQHKNSQVTIMIDVLQKLCRHKLQ